MLLLAVVITRTFNSLTLTNRYQASHPFSSACLSKVSWKNFQKDFILRCFFNKNRWRHWHVTSEPQHERIRAAKGVHGTDHAAQCPSDSTRAFRSILEAMHQNESKMWKDFVKTKFTKFDFLFNFSQFVNCSWCLAGKDQKPLVSFRQKKAYFFWHWCG